MTDVGDNGEVMGLVVRLVIQDKRSEQGIVIVLGHLMEVKDVSDLIAKKQHATLKDVQVTCCHMLLNYFNIGDMEKNFRTKLYCY